MARKKRRAKPKSKPRRRRRKIKGVTIGDALIGAAISGGGAYAANAASRAEFANKADTFLGKQTTVDRVSLMRAGAGATTAVVGVVVGKKRPVLGAVIVGVGVGALAGAAATTMEERAHIKKSKAGDPAPATAPATTPAPAGGNPHERPDELLADLDAQLARM